MNGRFRPRRIGISSSFRSSAIFARNATNSTSQPFDSIGAIMSLQAYHFILLLLRMKPQSFEQYYFKKYNNNLQKQSESNSNCHNYYHFARTYIWTAINWATLTGNLFVALNCLPHFEWANNEVLRIKHYSRFVWMAIVFFILTEYLWIDLFAQNMIRRDGRLRSLELLFEYGRTIDRTLTLSGDAADTAFRHKFICLYNRVKYVVTIFFRLSTVGLFAESFSVIIVIIGMFCGFAGNSETIGFGELIVLSTLSAITHVYGAHLLAITTYILCDTMSIILILTFKLKKCAQTLAKWKVIAEERNDITVNIHINSDNENKNDIKRLNQSISHFGKFQHQYVNVHTELLHYNELVCRLVFICDWGIKLGGTITICMLFSKKQLTNNTAGILIISVIAGVYLIIQLLFAISGYFPEMNSVFYRRVAAISARINTINRRRQQCESPLPNSNFKLLKILQKNRNKNELKNLTEKIPILLKSKHVAPTISTRFAVAMAIDLRYHLRIDAFVHFLAENRFGFSYSNINLIRRSFIMDKFFSALYFIILIMDKII